MDERCDAVETRGLIASADLAREFRNFVFHGGAQATGHADWGEDPAISQLILRFYFVARITLHLIQAMAWIIHEGDARLFKHGPYDEELTACQILTRLQFRGKEG